MNIPQKVILYTHGGWWQGLGPRWAENVLGVCFVKFEELFIGMNIQSRGNFRMEANG